VARESGGVRDEPNAESFRDAKERREPGIAYWRQGILRFLVASDEEEN
jgi:hypothetical protein